MSLPEIPSVTRVFVDASIFVYHGPTLDDLLASQEFKAALGFLQMTPSIMGHHLTHLATNNPNFARVDALTIWKPSPAPSSR